MNNKLTITIKRAKDETYKVIVTRNGERRIYNTDAPELEEYSKLIQFQINMMKSANADTAKVSFT